jgi:hypothetical protein
VKGVTGFLPVVAPASALPNAKNEHYRDEETLLFGLAEALGTEYRAIIDAGLDLQVDDAFIPYQYEKMVPPMTLADYRNWASLRIEALMPGLIAHSTNVVEHPDLVAERLLRYADIVGRDSVMAGTDCGFSQSPLAGRGSVRRAWDEARMWFRSFARVGRSQKLPPHRWRAYPRSERRYAGDQLGWCNSGFSRERRSVHPAARANSWNAISYARSGDWRTISSIL